MASRHGEYVLVVEDSDVDFDILCSVVTDLKRPIRLEREVSGEDTIEFLEKSIASQIDLPSLVLMDLNLIGISGIDVVKKIRSHSDLCKIPLVILSTSKSQSDVDAAYKAGANSYVAKPLKLEKFELVIENLLDYWYFSCLLPTHLKSVTAADRN